MAPTESFDAVVIGSGPGGYVAAIRAAQLGLRTAVIERDALGGICLNWGCIPSKALLTNAQVYRQFLQAQRWGIQVEGLSFDMDHIIDRSRRVADTLSKGVAYLMKKNDIEVVHGEASFVEPGRLEVDNGDGEPVQVGADHIIVATGARARSLPGVEIDGERVISYRQALELRRVPESIAIVGAGAIGCEFAYFYRSFGARVTIVELLDQLLPQEDAEVAAELQRSFKKQGIEARLETTVTGVTEGDQTMAVSIEGGDGRQETLDVDLVLVAVGVQGNTENLNLEAQGVEVERGRIVVDRWYRTATDGIYAIGDIVGPPLLAHVASHEGIVCVEKIAGENPLAVDYDTIPSCTYCQPQVASVGLTEERARDRGHEVRVGKFPFQVLGKARASQSTEGFVKLIFDAAYGELLGAHIIGEEATEMIAELVTAKALETTWLELLKTPHAHPTLSEAVMEAAGAAFGQQIHL